MLRSGLPAVAVNPAFRVRASPQQRLRASGHPRRVAKTPTRMSAVMVFTPAPALLGGLTLGVLTVAKLLLAGRVLGISGAVKGMVNGSQEVWRYLFVGGLAAGGLAMAALYPAVFDALPAGYSLSRAVATGTLVGVGTSLGGGCTSGHGICGNARLSARSLVATATFMATGALAAWQTRTAALFALPHGVAALGPTSPALYTLGCAALAASLVLVPLANGVAAALGGSDTAKSTAPVPAVRLVGDAVELATGFLFALGLGVSGMLRPSKVAAFLSVLAGSFDPSLAFVMGGALLVALPAYQWVLRSKNSPSRPVCCADFDLPTATKVDAKLVAGAALFGAGWGAGGMCPGPALVNLGAPTAQGAAFVAAMVAGMYAAGAVEKGLKKAAAGGWARRQAS